MSEASSLPISQTGEIARQCRMRLDPDVSAVVNELLDIHPYKGLSSLDVKHLLRADPAVEQQWKVSGHLTSLYPIVTESESCELCRVCHIAS
jgi:hypothetical protein